MHHDLLLFDDDAVDDQLQDLLLDAKGRVCQRLAHAGTKRFNSLQQPYLVVTIGPLPLQFLETPVERQLESRWRQLDWL